MIPLIVSGVFWAGVMLGKKLREPPDTWNSQEEEQHFHKGREQWMHEGWTLYEHLQR